MSRVESGVPSEVTRCEACCGMGYNSERMRRDQIRSLAVLLGLSRDASFAACCAAVETLLDRR